MIAILEKPARPDTLRSAVSWLSPARATPTETDTGLRPELAECLRAQDTRRAAHEALKAQQALAEMNALLVASESALFAAATAALRVA